LKNEIEVQNPALVKYSKSTQENQNESVDESLRVPPEQKVYMHLGTNCIFFLYSCQGPNAWHWFKKKKQNHTHTEKKNQH